MDMIPHYLCLVMLLVNVPFGPYQPGLFFLL